jgi:predicted nucleic acid-binding protein
MTVYLDSSVVLRALLRQPRVLRSWGEWESAFSSELLGVECRRAIDRLRLQGLYDDEGVAAATEELGAIERTINTVRLTPAVIRGASQAMPTVVKTLDALHLASAVAVRDRRVPDLVFATHDLQQAVGARALGFECLEA